MSITLIAVRDDALDLTAAGIPTTITVASIARTWDALTHFPERRARFELENLAERITMFSALLDRLHEAGGTIDPVAELATFTRRTLELTRRYWAMESRCLSWFVTGPANFPVRTNAKRQASRDKARGILDEHKIAARRAVERRAFPHGAPGGPIRSGNPDAPELIRAKITGKRVLHETMKTVNAAIRSVKTDDAAEIAQAIMDATGWPAHAALKLTTPDFAGRRGFPDFNLTNNLAEIKRLEGRLAEIERKRAGDSTERERATEAGAVRVVENVERDRVQIVFPGKPDAAVRARLKAAGFRWSPTETAWQRHLNAAGRDAAERILATLVPIAAE